ncbi:MAG: metallophosphoesterase family protein [Acidimicrobiales bacterium]
MAFRFLHAADLHLDTPFAGLSTTAPDVAIALRDASLQALDELVRVAISREVAFVVLAGDVYDGPERGVRAQLALHRGVSELAEHGIRTFVVAGNHDPVDEGWTAVRAWPDLVTFFPADAPASVSVERHGQHLATVHGISYATRSVTDDLSVRLSPHGHPGPHVAVLHANVGGHPDHDPYSPCSVDSLVGSGMDYWALGHVHTRQILARSPWVVYPGNLQARSARVSDRGAKGAYLVTVDDAGAVLEPEFVALDRVRFDHVQASIEAVPDIAALRDRLVDLGHRRLAEADGRSILLRVELVGRGAVHGDLRRPGLAADLIDGLRADARHHHPFVWWDRIDLSTRPLQDLDELSGRNDFVADLLDEAAAVRSDPGLRSARTSGWDDELPSDLAHLLGDDMPLPTDPARWEAARELAVDLVSSDD